MSETMARANDYLPAGHTDEPRWAALAQLRVDDPADWQDVSVRPAVGRNRKTSGFTVALCTIAVLEEDFADGVGPHPREKLPDGEDFALAVDKMCVYLRRPFSPPEALFWTEALLREAGVPVASLVEVGREEFYAGLQRGAP